MGHHPLAGKSADRSMIVNVPRLITAYYSERLDPAIPTQRVAFATSGHRGSVLSQSFNELMQRAVQNQAKMWEAVRKVLA
jgi:phosphoglucomutase